MRRKSNSVLLTERSSLQLYMAATNAPESVKQMVLDPKEYAMLGGGFPICVEEVGVVATVAVSGMGQVSDHDVIVKCISKYLHIDEVPRIRTTKPRERQLTGVGLCQQVLHIFRQWCVEG